MSCSTTEDGYNTDDGINNEHKGRTNYWNTRNNSSNVSAILNSELYNSNHGSNFLKSLKKHVVVSNHCYKTDKIPRFHCGECYCRRSPVYPKLTLKRPDQNCEKLKKSKCKSTHLYCQHNCCSNYGKSHSTTSLESNYSTRNKIISESMHLKGPSSQRITFRKPHETFKEPVVPKQGHVKPFQGAKNLNDHDHHHHQAQQLHEAPNSNDKNSAETNIHYKKKKNKLSQVKNSSNFSPTITSILESEKERVLENNNVPNMNETAFLDANVSPDKNLKKLITFRKENYFECHSTEHLSDAKVSEHKCVHKFVLNDRLVPQPLYADAFGTSRCTECDKPITSEIVRSDKETAVRKEKTNYQTNVVRKSPCCINRQTKYKIKISTNSDRVEIKVPISVDKYNELFNTCFKIKNPISANSLALRHQKGVV